jgi:hypothetical protein
MDRLSLMWVEKAPMSYGTCVPKRRPTLADAAMASAPQKATRIAPRPIAAPPTRAATAPRTVNKTNALAVTSRASHAAGAIAATITGSAAPVANATADVAAA